MRPIFLPDEDDLTRTYFVYVKANRQSMVEKSGCRQCALRFETGSKKKPAPAGRAKQYFFAPSRGRPVVLCGGIGIRITPLSLAAERIYASPLYPLRQYGVTAHIPVPCSGTVSPFMPSVILPEPLYDPRPRAPRRHSLTGSYPRALRRHGRGGHSTLARLTCSISARS